MSVRPLQLVSFWARSTDIWILDKQRVAPSVGHLVTRVAVIRLQVSSEHCWVVRGANAVCGTVARAMARALARCVGPFRCGESPSVRSSCRAPGVRQSHR